MILQAGTIAGELDETAWASFSEEVASFKGIAYRAKIAVFDFGTSIDTVNSTHASGIRYQNSVIISCFS